MTHAALQDLVKKWRADAEDCRQRLEIQKMSALIDRADELAAALSAMEGEAVLDPTLCRFYDVDSWPALVAAQEEHVLKLQDTVRRNVKPWEDTFPPTLLPKYLRDTGLDAAEPVTRTVVVEVATAPPPQQAEPDYKFPPEVAEWFGVPHDYPHSLRAATDERDELLRDYVKLAKALGFKQYTDFDNVLTAATHPTPSPGPQGGRDDPAEAAYWRFDARHKGYGQWKQAPMSERDAFKAEYRAALATPPQPEAQVSDAMVSIIHRHCGKTSNLSKYILDDLTAALTTSGRDGDG